jgi:histone demethylase JARID1
MEVTMDETQHIWRLLQATEPRRSKKYPDLNQLEAELENAREEKVRAKKKRKLEMSKEGSVESPTVTAENGASEAKQPKIEGSTSDKKGRKGGRTRKRDSEEEQEQEQEEEQEDCSASPKCLKPVGKEVKKIWGTQFVIYISI